MTTQREAIIAAFTDAITSHLGTAVPNASVLRNPDTTVTPTRGGLVLIEDGDPGEPIERTLGSPGGWYYEHPVRVTILVSGSNKDIRAATCDDLVAAVGAAAIVDRSLGGLASWVETSAPDVGNEQHDGGDAVTTATADIVIAYTLTNPMG